MYANQTIVWKRRTGVNAYNEPTFSVGAVITGRFQDEVKYLRKTDGTEILSSIQVITQGNNIAPGDMLDDHTVIYVQNSRDIDGSILFKVVYLE
jgi:hypothetical protein